VRALTGLDVFVRLYYLFGSAENRTPEIIGSNIGYAKLTNALIIKGHCRIFQNWEQIMIWTTTLTGQLGAIKIVGVLRD
jgi:hypothetical protein